MKSLPGISLVVLGTMFVAFSVIACAIAMPTSLDGRAVFLAALFVSGGIFEAIGVRDLVRAKRLASGLSAT